MADWRKGKPSARRIPLAMAEKVLGLYKETYYDLNIRHFREKLRDKHDIERIARRLRRPGFAPTCRPA